MPRSPIRTSRVAPTIGASLVLTLAAGGPAPETGPRAFEPVRAVEFSILAVDVQDEPVENLTGADLEVKVGGRPVVHRLMPKETPRPGEAPPVRLALSFGAREQIAESSLFSPSYYLFLIDLSPDSTERKSMSRDALLDFVRTLPESDYAAVASFRGELELELPFTTDRERVVEALSRAFDQRRSPAVAARQRIRRLFTRLEICESISDNPFMADEEENESATVVSGALAVNDRCVLDQGIGYVQSNLAAGQQFLHAIEGTIRLAGGVRGRSNVVAITHGVSLDPEAEFLEAARGLVGQDQLNDYRDSLGGGEILRTGLTRLARIARSERATLYFVDPATPPGSMKGARQASLLIQSSSPLERTFALARGTLQALADATGGAVLHESTVAASLQKLSAIEQDGRHLLRVYVPKDVELDRKSAVAIKSRRPGIRIQHGAGLEPPRDLQTRGSLSVGKVQALSEPARMYVPFALGAPPADLGYQEGKGQRFADLTVHVVLETGDGLHLASQYGFFRHTIPEEELGSGLGLAVRGWLEAPAGEYRLSATFRNPRTGSALDITRRIAIAAD